MTAIEVRDRFVIAHLDDHVAQLEADPRLKGLRGA